MKKLFFFIFTMCLSQIILAQTTGDYRSKQSGVWATASNWETYNGTAWNTAASVPPSNCSIVIQSGHSITNGNASRTVTGNTITVNGTLDIDQATLTIASTSSVIVNGTLKRTGTITNNGSITVNNGGTYQHNTNASNPTVPTITWQTGSTCEILGGSSFYGNISGLNQTFYHFKVNGSSWYGDLQCVGSLTTINGNLIINNTGGGTKEFRLTSTTSYTLNIGGDLIVSGGTINFGSGSSGTRTINIGGSFNQSGGIVTNSTTSCTINFTGLDKTFTKSSGTLTNTYINWTIRNTASLTLTNDLPVASSRSLTVNGTLDCSTLKVSGTGAFTLNSGATLKTKDALGINGSLTVSGTKTLNTGSNYEFNGTSAQVTGALLPATVNNLTIDNTAGLTLTGSATINGTLELINGAVGLGGNTLGYGASGILKYSGSTTQTSTTNEWPLSNPPNEAIINGSDVILDLDRTLSGNLTINNSKKFTINSNKQLTVNGTTTNSTAANFVIKSGASFKNSSTNVAATMERDIAAANWSVIDEGWHLLSSPVVNQSISGSFAPTGTGNDYDFYAWDEATYTWLNQKIPANSITTFGSGLGYSVAYQQAGTKTFSGNLHNTNVTVNLSFANPTVSQKGFNLLGNPYPCAIDWSTGSWTKTNVESYAKIWDAIAKNYIDIALVAAPNTNIIPANQGFFIKATATGGTITIPTDARVHSGQGFYKSTNDMLIMKISKNSSSVYDVAAISFNSQSTNLYNPALDASEMEPKGNAPSFYSLLTTGEKLSINTMPIPTINTIVTMGFVAGTNGTYTLNASNLANISFTHPIVLEDTKTGINQNLIQNPTYQFTATTTDNINRFKIHFNVTTGIQENENNETLVYSNDGQIIVSSNSTIKVVEIYNEVGQQLGTYKVNGNKFQAKASSKVQIIRILTSDSIIVRKIVVL